VRVANDASTLVVTSRKPSAHKPIMQQCNEHALSPAKLRKEGGDSCLLGADTSPQKSRSRSPGKEKIEALRGLSVRSSISGAKNLSGSNSKPDVATELPNSKNKSNSTTSSLKSENKVKEEVHPVILPPFPSLFLVLFFYLILLLMQGYTVEIKDRLKAVFGDKDSEATLTVPAAKSTEDDSINIMPSPVKQAEHCQSPTPSVATYFPGRIGSGVFNDLALSVKRLFQQQLKKFIPKKEGDLANICQEVEQIYGTLSSFQADYLGLKNSVKAYLNAVG